MLVILITFELEFNNLKKRFLYIILLCILQLSTWSQDSSNTNVVKNGLLIKSDSTILHQKEILINNATYNLKAISESYTQRIRSYNTLDLLFYILIFLMLFLSVFKLIYQKYFTNLARVFLNTTLRQSQLVDQLLIAKLQSLVMNIFFFITAGIYVFLLLKHTGKVGLNDWSTMLICIAFVACLYVLKYVNVIFFGWLTGFKNEVENYLFIVFLINKITGIILIPFLFIISFAKDSIVESSIVLSILLLVILLIIRYLRAFGALKSQLRVSRFHFFVYVIAIEIIPILLICKQAMIILNKSL